MKKNQKSLRRLNLAIKPEVHERMEKLCEATEADSITDLIRRSLAIYDYLWSHKKAGSDLIIREKDGKEQAIVFL